MTADWSISGLKWPGVELREFLCAFCLCRGVKNEKMSGCGFFERDKNGTE